MCAGGGMNPAEQQLMGQQGMQGFGGGPQGTGMPQGQMPVANQMQQLMGGPQGYGPMGPPQQPPGLLGGLPPGMGMGGQGPSRLPPQYQGQMQPNGPQRGFQRGGR